MLLMELGLDEGNTVRSSGLDSTAEYDEALNVVISNGILK